MRVQNRNLRKAREERGWTQKDVTSHLDLPDVRTFRRWECGEAFPSLRYRIKLCELFAMSAEDLGLIPTTETDLSLSESSDTHASSKVHKKPERASLYSLLKQSLVQSEHSSSMDWNRQQFIKKVQAFWINDIWDKSFHNMQHLQFEVREEPGAVTNAWEGIVTPIEHPLSTFSVDTPIIQIYDAAGGELLILGEPGSGKTMMLIEITRHLLERALNDEQHPLPAIFNLSSWSSTRQTLEAWLVDELYVKYQVPTPIGQMWMACDAILPLLDGLDEVNIASRTSCGEAISAFRSMHGLVPMVVCCRKQEYSTMGVRILLQKAISIQPLRAHHRDMYLLNEEVHLQELGSPQTQSGSLNSADNIV
jgi:transcriptional regulator with XRE-family HTH domain